LQIPEDSGKYWKILENTGYTSIADTGRFWKILVIPVLQILENTGYTSIADTGRLGTKLRNVLVYWFFFCSCLCICYEDEQCIGRPGERRSGVGKEGREQPIFNL
jgi:succinate-acetate transporter protein